MSKKTSKKRWKEMKSELFVTFALLGSLFDVVTGLKRIYKVSFRQTLDTLIR
jgi:hypothetical protein